MGDYAVRAGIRISGGRRYPARCARWGRCARARASPGSGRLQRVGFPHTVDAGDASQEAILDLIVAATLAQDDPLDDELADADYWDPGDLRDLWKDRDLRNDEVTPSGAAADESASPGWGSPQRASSMGSSPDLRSLG